MLQNLGRRLQIGLPDNVIVHLMLFDEIFQTLYHILLMPRRMSEYSETPTKYAKEDIKEEVRAAPQHLSPILKIIIAIAIAFLGTVGYQSYQGIIAHNQTAKNKAKNCLVDFSKASCNIASPSESCKSLLDCAISGD